MARRKFRSNQRHEPATERSFQEYYLSTPAPQTSRIELLRLIRGGEDTFLELKVKLSNPERIAQEIVALANTGGGVVVFGVNDQLRIEGVDDPESVQDELVRICREDVEPPLFPFVDRIAFDSGRRIVALDIEGKHKPYRTRDGRFYVRISADKREASHEEMAALFDEARPLRFENLPALGATLNDIDEAHLWSFLREFDDEAINNASAKGYPTSELLEKDLLLATEYRGDIVPTIAGLMLFGRNERVPTLLPRSAVSVTRYAGESSQSSVVEQVSITGHLLTLYESTMRFIARYCDLWETRPRKFPAADVDSPITARANYHRSVIAECIGNLIVHRDLALRDQTTRINIYDRSIEFVNPRRTAGFSTVAVRAIRHGVAQRLNPQLTSIFSNHAYGANLPVGGLPMVIREGRKFSDRRPEIAAFNDEFRLRVYGV
jgi:ATP-dependent DNA helicase RecG